MPKRWLQQFRHLLPVVFLNTVGLVLADYSLFSGTLFVTLSTRAAQSSTTIILTNMPRTIWAMFPLVICSGGIYRAIVATSSLLDTCFLAGMASNIAFTLRGVYSRRVSWQRATPANNFGIITMLSFFCMVPVAYYVEGEDVRAAVENMSTPDREAALLYLALCGFAFFLSIEVAYLMFDPRKSSFTRSLEDIIRQGVTMGVATLYFQENTSITRNMAIGYGIALAGQLLQSLDQLSSTSKQLSVKTISPRKTSPKLKKRAK